MWCLRETDFRLLRRREGGTRARDRDRQMRKRRINVGKPAFSFSLAQRVCLGCGESFASKGVGNRICQPCKKTAARGHPIGEDGRHPVKA